MTGISGVTSRRMAFSIAVLVKQFDDIIEPVEIVDAGARLQLRPREHSQCDQIYARLLHQTHVFVPLLPVPLFGVVVAAVKNIGLKYNARGHIWRVHALIKSAMCDRDGYSQLLKKESAKIYKIGVFRVLLPLPDIKWAQLSNRNPACHFERGGRVVGSSRWVEFIETLSRPYRDLIET